MSVGERIAQLRKEKNLSQGQLASLLDVSRQAVSKWENDATSPDSLRLMKLADVLSTEVEYLVTGVHPVYQSPPIVVNLIKNEDPPKEIVKEKIVEKVVVKPVEKPVIRKVVRVQYRTNPLSLGIAAVSYFLLGLLIGLFL